MTVWLNTDKVRRGSVASMLLEPNLAIWNKIATLVAAALAVYLSVVDPKNALDRALQVREEYRTLFTKVRDANMMTRTS